MLDTTRRFGGISRLYGSTAHERFEKAHLCVVGVGGVGSWVAESFARSGVGALTLIDLDMVAESNVNRQIHAHDGNFGKAKVHAMAERILSINPHCKLNLIEDFVTAENIPELFGTGFDYVVDAIDAAKVKVAMIAWCRRNNLPMITAGAAGGKSDPSRIMISDLSQTIQDPLLARVRSLLRKEYGFSREKGKKFSVPAVFSTEQIRMPDGSCDAGSLGVTGLNCAGYGSAVCVTASFGLFAAGYVLQQIAHKKA